VGTKTSSSVAQIDWGLGRGVMELVSHVFYLRRKDIHERPSVFFILGTERRSKQIICSVQTVPVFDEMAVNLSEFAEEISRK